MCTYPIFLLIAFINLSTNCFPAVLRDYIVCDMDKNTNIHIAFVVDTVPTYQQLYHPVVGIPLRILVISYLLLIVVFPTISAIFPRVI